MPTYISLLRFTQQGMENIKKLPDMLDLQKMGFGPAMEVRLREIFLVTGRYDAVAILEAASEEALAKFLLNAGSLGNVRSETLRAFNEEETRKLLAALP